MLHDPGLLDATSASSRILESLQHPVIVVDAAGEITYANAIAAVSFDGWIVGTKLNEIFPDYARSLAVVSGPSCMRLTTSRNEDYEALLNPIGGGSICGSFWPIAAPGVVQEVQQSDDLTHHALRTLS